MGGWRLHLPPLLSQGLGAADAAAPRAAPCAANAASGSSRAAPGRSRSAAAAGVVIVPSIGPRAAGPGERHPRRVDKLATTPGWPSLQLDTMLRKAPGLFDGNYVASRVRKTAIAGARLTTQDFVARLALRDRPAGEVPTS